MSLKLYQQIGHGYRSFLILTLFGFQSKRTKMKINIAVLDQIIASMQLFHRNFNLYSLLPLRFIHPYFLLHPGYAEFIEELIATVDMSKNSELKRNINNIINKHGIKTKIGGRYPMPYLEQDEIKTMALESLKTRVGK